MDTDMIARGMACSLQNKIEGYLSVKNNLNATMIPTVTDDIDSGYSVGSIWIYEGVTYTCVDSKKENAIWTASSNEIYIGEWSELSALLIEEGTEYVGKFAHVANANNGISSGLTYVYPNVMTDYIVDGGSAIYKINAQGVNWSVTCLTRTITNPVVTSVMLVPSTKPTTKGYYIFSVIPTDGLPIGINLNDICYYDGTNWSVFQRYNVASAVLVAGTTTNTQVTWRKFNGRWMSTADDYVPDGLEYQTGKLWNGKAVYRKCASGTTNASYTTGTYTATGMTIPYKEKVLRMDGSITRTDGTRISFNYMADGISFYIDNSLEVRIAVRSTLFVNGNYLAWVEYTKS